MNQNIIDLCNWYDSYSEYIPKCNCHSYHVGDRNNADMIIYQCNRCQQLTAIGYTFKRSEHLVSTIV